MDSALTLLKAGGVFGGGGAGFPTWKKLAAPAETLIINGAECEPLLKSDQFLMLQNADTLVLAADALREIVGASKAIIALKAHYEQQTRALETALKARDVPVSLCILPAVYPVGDEQAIVYASTGKIVPPQSLPGSVGCCVVSVSTALNAWAALRGIPVTKRLVTVTGLIRRPGLYDVPIGTSVRDVIGTAGGATVSAYSVLLGGPMMGELLKDWEQAVITKTNGGVLVLPETHLLARRASLSLTHMRNRAKSACIQCRFCTDLCPRYLLGHALYPHRVMRAFAMDRADPSALLCMECGICEMYACPMGLSPRRVQASLKPWLRDDGTQPDRELYPRQGAMRDGRQVPSERLSARIAVSEYDMPVPEKVVAVTPGHVCIPLKQHIGVLAKACVLPGDRVAKGQVIGEMDADALGANVHASIGGTVVSVEDSICIQAEVL